MTAVRSRLRGPVGFNADTTVAAAYVCMCMQGGPKDLKAKKLEWKNADLRGSAKRIQKELVEIALDPPSNCSAGPKDDNIYEWVANISECAEAA